MVPFLVGVARFSLKFSELHSMRSTSHFVTSCLESDLEMGTLVSVVLETNKIDWQKKNNNLFCHEVSPAVMNNRMFLCQRGSG